MARAKAPALTWANLPLAPIMLVKGSEGLLADRAVARARALARQQDPNLERTDVSAATYRAGQLDVLTSPSLFGEARYIEVPDLETMTDALLADLLAYVEHPAEDVWMLLRHNGGVRGKKLLDAIARAGHPVVAAEPLKYDKDKLALVMEDVRAAGRRIEPAAAQALVDALGSDLRSLAAAVGQLLSDVDGVITAEAVHRYHAGRVEATGFEVADATIAGESARALTLARHALVTGVAPPALVGAIAMKFRAMAKVSVAGGTDGKNRMAPWQAERARRDLRGWSDRSLAGAFTALAVADEETKGLSRDADWAVEKLIVTLCRLRGGR